MSFPPKPATKPPRDTSKPNPVASKRVPPTSSTTLPPPRSRIVPSRNPSTAPSTPSAPLPSLEESTALFISKYLLGSLRSSAAASDARYLAVERELSGAVEALELEVGETRRRREVEGELELLRGMEGREDLLATFGKAAEGIEESSLLLNAVEERSLGVREGIEQIYQSQLVLAGCMEHLERLVLSDLPSLAALQLSSVALVRTRLDLLASTRERMEKGMEIERLESRKRIGGLVS